MGFSIPKEAANVPLAPETSNVDPSTPALVVLKGEVKDDKSVEVLTIKNRYQQPPVPCTGCTKEGQSTGVRMAVFQVGQEHLCPVCTTEMEKSGIAVYQHDNVVHGG